jgi:hypothetical protein
MFGHFHVKETKRKRLTFFSLYNLWEKEDKFLVLVVLGFLFLLLMQHCIIQQYYKNSVQHLTCVSYVQHETCDNENLDMFIQLFSLKKLLLFSY